LAIGVSPFLCGSYRIHPPDFPASCFHFRDIGVERIDALPIPGFTGLLSMHVEFEQAILNFDE
jgi:hypothetical protein